MEKKYTNCKKCKRELPKDWNKSVCENCLGKNAGAFKKTGKILVSVVGAIIAAPLIIYNMIKNK